ncbi:MAG: hypothetical protein NNA22_07845, partial [Nitrospira sp.]|nr:hypothetical protein [Nitrospira sp.]
MESKEFRLMESSDNTKAVEVEPDTDSRQASGLLEAIGREGREFLPRDEEAPTASEDSRGTGAFFMES